MIDALRHRLISWRNHYYHRGVVVSSRSSLNPHAQIDQGVRIGRDCTILKARVSGFSSVDDCVLICDDVVVHSSKIGAGCRIERGAHLAGAVLESGVAVHPNADLTDVTVGRFSFVARETIVNDVEVGQFCSIGPRCLLGSGDHPVDWISTSPAFYSTFRQTGISLVNASAGLDSFTERRRIVIGHDVWIGAHVFVRDGIRIGNGAIIAAGAVVARDVPEFAVVGGIPARNIRFRFTPERINRLLSIAWWDWPEELLRAAQPLIASTKIDDLITFARARHCRM